MVGFFLILNIFYQIENFLMVFGKELSLQLDKPGGKSIRNTAACGTDDLFSILWQ